MIRWRDGIVSAVEASRPGVVEPNVETTEGPVAVTLHTGLLAARLVLRADLAIVTKGYFTTA